MCRYECVLMALGLFSLHIDAQNIQNVDSIPELNEVLVTGYRTISRERAAGSYDIVNSKEIEKRHTLSTSSILDGIVAGMQGQSDGRGGTKFTIRGTGTMYADELPLIVVDGFPLMDIPDWQYTSSAALTALEKINPNDIESITILKDAAAASIWGARASNGVIVIKTKGGTSNGQRWEVRASTQLSFSNKRNVDQLTNMASSENTVKYLRLLSERGWDTSTYYGGQYNLKEPVSWAELYLYKGQLGMMSKEEVDESLNRLSTLDNRKQIKKYLLQNPMTSQTNASIGYNNGKFQSNFSTQYQYDYGDFIGKENNQFTLNWNNRYNFNKHVVINMGVHLQSAKSKSSVINESDLLKLSPYEMLLDENGNYVSQIGSINPDVINNYFDVSKLTYTNLNYNILQEARNSTIKKANVDYRFQIGLRWNINESLSFNSKFQYEGNRFDEKTTYGEESFFTRWNVDYLTPTDWDGTIIGTSALPKGEISYKKEGKYESLVFRNDFNYNHIFNNLHNVNAIFGNEISKYQRHLWNLPYKYAGTTPESDYYGSLAGYEDQIIGLPENGKQYLLESWENNRFVSFYGNASYTYDNRYTFTTSARSDASNMIVSKPKYRWSPFWSIGVMWNLTGENFLKDNNFWDLLKLRLTYGKTGNTSSYSSARVTVSSSSSMDAATSLYPYKISDYGNHTLRWEKTATTNIGVDFSILNHRIWGSFDYYKKYGDDLLGRTDMPTVTGMSEQILNNAHIVNSGIEVSLHGRTKIAKFHLGADLTYSYNKNKISKMNWQLSDLSSYLNTSYAEGYAMYPIFTFKYAGLSEDGVPQVKDIDGNTLRIDDRSLFYGDPNKLMFYQGTKIAPHSLGVQLRCSYSNFEISTLFSGRFGNKVQMPTFDFVTPTGYSKIFVNAQVNEALNGTSAIPIPDVTSSESNIDGWSYMFWNTYAAFMNTSVEDGSYIYCKEIVLNYNFPKLLTSKLNLKDAGLFIKVENVGLLWSANSNHWHPEYLPGISCAPTTTWQFGINVNL